ncbi:MAG: class I SAM-dependent methyltransferase [Planctomycetota bacterium]|jgi:23S rRNA (cytosine1962-C5)-methyltransferase|nr:class I SAM-dependent methyltransferase [Planctomycetota bacterium]
MRESGPVADGYEYLDSGNGRRLERFGATVVDRPAPGALHSPGLSAASWREAALHFEKGRGWNGVQPEEWQVRFGPARLRIRPASGGQLGVFPEHAALCDKVAAAVHEHFPEGGLRALNLFAHTGLATLRIAASPGVAETVHVDAARSAVNAARENADLSGIGDARIRWLTDDVLQFVRREIRRGRRYGVIVVDPPSFGKGGKSGGEWKFRENIGALMDAMAEVAEERALLLLSAHGEGLVPDDLARLARKRLRRIGRVETGESILRSNSGGAPLRLGAFVLARAG